MSGSGTRLERASPPPMSGNSSGRGRGQTTGIAAKVQRPRSLRVRSTAANDRARKRMPHTDDFHRAELIDRVCECARWRLGDDAAAASAAFIRRYYAHVFTDDIDSQSADTLFGAAYAHWRLGERRSVGTTIVRVYNPRLDEHGWRSEHTIVEVVTDDMPFLVDSVTAELNRRDLTVHLVVHPILRVRRDPSGRLEQLAGAGRAARRRLGRVVHARRGHPPGRPGPGRDRRRRRGGAGGRARGRRRLVRHARQARRGDQRL